MIATSESQGAELLAVYLRSRGWAPSGRPGPVGDLWSRPDISFKIPLPAEVEPGSDDWNVVVERLAASEHRTPVHVAFEVAHWSVDVASARAANDLVIEDTIPFEAGAQMVTSLWRMFRSSATAAYGPRPQIKGNYSRLGDETVGRARMAHTERGSYVIPILLPLSTPTLPDNGATIAGLETVAPEPPERRVMRTFAQSLQSLHDVAIQPEHSPRRGEIAALVAAGVTREFASALRDILVAPAVATFSAGFRWAPSVDAPGSVPSKVEIPASASVRVGQLAQRLVASKPTNTELITGPLIGVRRDTDDLVWSLQVQATRRSRPAEVWVTVSPEIGERATSWMRQRETVVVYGTVSRGAGNHLRINAPQTVSSLSETMLGAPDDTDGM